MSTELAPPPITGIATLDRWLNRLWKRITSTTSSELGLGTMADQNADAVAITGGSATLSTLSVTNNGTTDLTASQVSRTYTDSSSGQYGQIAFVHTTDATNGARYHIAGRVSAYTVVNTSKTNSGFAAANYHFAVRNGYGASEDDSGTLTAQYASLAEVGHQNANGSATPQTTNSYGYYAKLWRQTGTIANAYGFYLAAPSGSGTVTNLYGSYLNVASTDATNAYGYYSAGTAQNYFAGTVKTGTTISVGAATPATSGAGVTFPATQSASSDANTLDDYREATFTATATGMTTSPTGTATFIRTGNQVTLEVPTISGTSNNTAFTLTGMPTTCRPSGNRTVVARTKDNSGSYAMAVAIISSAGVITLYKDANESAFTASGTKAVGTCNISYII